MSDQATVREGEINEIKTELLPSTNADTQKATVPTATPSDPHQPNITTPKPEELSHNVSGLGDEVVIFASSIDNSPQAQLIKSFIDQILVHSALMVLALVLLSLSALRMYMTSTPDMSLIFLSLGVYFLGQLAIGLHALRRHLENRRELKRTIVGAASAGFYVVSYTAFYLFFRGVISNRALIFLLLPNAVGQIIRYTFFNHLEDTIFTMPFFCLAESMTHVMFALKLSEPVESPAVWGFVLMWYHVVYYFCWSFIVLIIAAGLIYLSFLIFQPEMFEGVERFKLIMVPICGSAIMLFLIAICLFFFGFQQLLDAGLVGPNANKVEVLPNGLKVAAIYSLVLGSILLIVIAVVALCYREALVRRFYKMEGKVISLKSYIHNLTLRVKRVSGNYFVKSNKVVEQTSEQKNFEMGEPQEMDHCTVCYDKPSTVLLDPCRHCIFCEDCIKDYLKTQDKCPMCRGAIEKGFIIFFDEEKKCYVTNKSIKIKIDGEEDAADD